MAFGDDSRAVSAEIKAAAGGEIVATAEDGTRYRLVFPRNSLLADTRVTLTPWSGGADGFDGAPSIGFDVQPGGTILFNPALVYIEPGENAVRHAARGDILLFETSGTIDQRARVALTPDDGFGLYLFHFSGGGAFAGAAQVEKFFIPPAGQLDGFLDLSHRERVSGLGYEEVMGRIGDWQRRVRQDRQAGRIGDFKAEEQLRILDHMMQQAWEAGADRREAIVDQAADQGAKRQDVAIANAEAVAEAGNWMDRGLLLDAIGEWIGLERQQQILNRPGSGRNLGEILDLLVRFGENVARRCGAEIIAPREILTITRLGVLLGGEEAMGGRWSDVAARLAACKPKITLDEAIERCFGYGDYRIVVDLYGWLVSSAGAGTLEQIDLPGPDKLSALTGKVLDALRRCAVYEVKLKVDSEARHRNSYVANTGGLDPPDEVSYRWHWDGTAVARFASFGPGDPVLGGIIRGPQDGQVSGCDCTILVPGHLESCTMRTCRRFEIDDPTVIGLGLRDLAFAGRTLERLSFTGAVSQDIARYICRVDQGERYCGDEGGGRMTLLGCLDRMLAAGGFLTVPMLGVPGSPAWRGSFKCGPQVITADDPPDNGYEKQYETGEIEIRHIGTR
ncbi:MAG: hypothetical protein U1E53_25400 [Dongiaceae bacterium]